MLQTHLEPQLYAAPAAYAVRKQGPTMLTSTPDITLHTVSPTANCRAEVEAFIAAVFKSAYAADIRHFMPELVALRDAHGVLLGAFGMRNAATEPLFLEQYIDEPIEQLFSRHFACAIQRHEITCIGNLAVANPRHAGLLITYIIRHTLDIGLQWAVATAHHRLQNGLIKGGCDTYPLAIADPAKLPLEEQTKWGRYYDRIPQIVAIRGVSTVGIAPSGRLTQVLSDSAGIIALPNAN